MMVEKAPPLKQDEGQGLGCHLDEHVPAFTVVL